MPFGRLALGGGGECETASVISTTSAMAASGVEMLGSQCYVGKECDDVENMVGSFCRAVCRERCLAYRVMFLLCCFGVMSKDNNDDGWIAGVGGVGCLPACELERQA